MQRGPLEQAVWNELETRPAGVINRAGLHARNCFAALFNGARRGTIFKPGQIPFFGKAEAEWAWPDGWNELKQLGLVKWTEVERPCHPSFNAPPMVDIEWSITDRGREVRTDDLKWFNELMDAREADEKQSQ